MLTFIYITKYVAKVFRFGNWKWFVKIKLIVHIFEGSEIYLQLSQRDREVVVFRSFALTRI